MAQQNPYSDLEHFCLTAPAPFVAHVEFNRPAKLNAFHEPMWRELGRLFRRISTDPDIRVVVLSGSGDRAFTAGIDISSDGQESILQATQGVDAGRQASRLRQHVLEFQESVSAVEKCQKPVVCVMHGICYGLAIDISSCADVRICARGARFSVKEVDIGLAADIGTLARLPKNVASASWVKDVCLSAREFGADEALSVGFVSQVHESKPAALDAALKWAASVASKSPVAVQGTKELLNHARDHSVAENLHYTAVWNSAALQSKDVQVALVSGMRKTTPTFEKL